jgi:hypothetical protein
MQSRVDDSPEGREEAAKERTQDKIRRAHQSMKLHRYMERVANYAAAWEAHRPLTSIDEFIPES